MKKIELEDSQYEFLSSLAEELRTQDNRATADPKFYQIKTKKRIFGVNSEWTDDFVYMDPCNPEYHYETLEDVRDSFLEDDREEIAILSDEELEYELLEVLEWEKVGYVEIEEFGNCFLTEKAIKKHIENYSYNYNDPIDFLCYVKRNPELEELLSIVKEIK